MIKPFTPLLPEVASPENKMPFNQKSDAPVLFYATALADIYQVDVDGLNFTHLSGHEPDALIWNCIVSGPENGFGYTVWLTATDQIPRIPSTGFE